MAKRAVRAPLRSMMALVTKVVPCTRCLTWDGLTPRLAKTFLITRSTPREGSSEVVRTLPTVVCPVWSSTISKSVKVPPMSTPMR